MSESFVGVRIDRGVQPFQIVQQNARGLGRLTLEGRARHPQGAGTVELRIVREDDAGVVVPWQSADQRDGERWSHTFDAVPAGGLYRIETRLSLPGVAEAEWAVHGDLLHHLGVGDLWIIAGQSNAAGYGRGPVHDPPQLGCHVLRNDETWDLATHLLNETTRSTHPNLENANPGHSPYLSFAKALHDALGHPIGLVQTALGGSALSQWNPVENADAPLYRNLRHCVNLAGGRVRGMAWYQGESDANPDAAGTYERRFAEFVGRLRSDLDQPDLPVIIAQLNRYPPGNDPAQHRAWSTVREAQRRVGRLGHAAVVGTLDLPLSDLIHTSSDGNVTLGRRKARAALELVYGRSVSPWRSPDLARATLGDDRRSIDLTFADVATRLQFIGPPEQDFRVEDAAGVAEITAVTPTARDTLRLTLARPVEGPVTVHGAYGTNPTSHVRDAEHNLPMLGFSVTVGAS